MSFVIFVKVLGELDEVLQVARTGQLLILAWSV
jgi:hypothetical protein